MATGPIVFFLRGGLQPNVLPSQIPLIAANGDRRAAVLIPRLGLWIFREKAFKIVLEAHVS